MKKLFQIYKGIDQIILWLFMFLFVIDYHLQDDLLGALFYTSLEVCSYAVVFYTNYLLLIPAFLKRNKKVLYGISLVFLYVVYILGIRYSSLEESLYEQAAWRNNLSMFLNTSLFLLISILYFYYQEWQLEKERQMELENEKLVAELKFLKTQISPHFIFNTLNNIYSLTLQKHENAAPMVAKLSKIMRYILYDCSENKVALEKEVDNIQNYINLHLLRMPESDNIDFYTEGNFAGLNIAPLLLINFVENCFKHSDINENKDAWIRISCIVEEDKSLNFCSENSYQKSIKKSIKNNGNKVGGIGLENIKRQLELNYKNKHELTITENDGIYKVDLNIEL